MLGRHEVNIAEWRLGREEEGGTAISFVNLDSLPSDAVLLAGSPASPVQAFRHGTHAYGFQFHLETNRPLIERWLTVPAHQETLDEEQDSVDPDAIRKQADTSVGPLEDLSRATFSRWIERFEIAPRRQRLPSR